MAPLKGVTRGTAGRSTAGFGTPVPAAVVITSVDNPDNPVQVQCEQASPFTSRPPRPRWQTVDRPGRIGVPEFLGQDPYEMTGQIRLDGYPDRSVEPEIAILEGFAEVPAGQSEPPVVTVSGAIPRPHPNLKWRLTDIQDPDEQQFLPGGQQRCRYVTTITLTQHVSADVLEESLHATSASKGIKTRTTKVRPGEDLYAVARRFYGDPSRASDIARANFQGGRPLRLGQELKSGTTLRMPS